MALYQCKVGSERGEVFTRTVAAESIDDVRREIESKGLMLLAAKKNWLNALISPSRLVWRRIGEQEFLIFNQEFAALVRSGLPILHALDVIVGRIRPGFFKDTLTDIREKIKSGYLLSEAFKEKKNLFPAVYSASLLAGERSGSLDTVLRRYMVYQQQLLAARRKIRSAMMYPIVLFVVAMTIGAIMTLYIIPKFSQVYTDYGANLPALTEILIGTATFLREHIAWAIAVLVIGVVAFRVWSQKESGRLTVDRWKFKVPLVGRVWHEFSIAQYCRTLATLLAGGIPVVDAMDVAGGAMNNSYMSVEIKKSVQKVREGEALSTSLESTGLFTPMALEMIQVGETTGSLDSLLNEAANFYDQQVETRVSTLLALLEPLVLLVMAVIIAFMLLSIYLPLFNLSHVIE